MNREPLLECRDITVRFGGLEALSKLSLSVFEGELLGIAGPNGAGKTTLFNVISGHVGPASCDIFFKGRSITRLAPEKIFQAGVARTFQLPELIGTQSIHTNILVGAHFAHDKRIRDTLAFSERSYDAAADALSDFRLMEVREKLASSAYLYERKMIMLASAMAHAPRILLLDEPVAGLSEAEAESIMDHVRRIVVQGTTVVMIEHVMRVLMAVADRFVLLNRGRLFFDGNPA